MSSSSTIPPAAQAPLSDGKLAEIAAARYTVRSLAIADAHVDLLLAEVQRLKADLATAERDVRWSIAEDFSTFGQTHESFNWGEAHLIAREGLCVCRGGSKPCNDGGAA